MTEADIDALETQWQEAFNAGDAAGVASLYADDGRLLAPNADVVQGRTAIEAFVKDVLGMGATMTFAPLAVHRADHLTVAVGRYEMELNPAGGERQTDVGKFVEVWQRQPDGSWLIVDDIWNSNLPAGQPELIRSARRSGRIVPPRMR
jgi:uncharacterized protein (TIGR02246 family)